MINKTELQLLKQALEKLEQGFSRLPGFTPEFDVPAASEVLQRVAERMQDNYPYYHPQYAGQMLKPPHPVARIAYALSLWVNPNNHALDGGRASSAMEKECVRDIGAIFGWNEPLGHLTGGGTMANLEALWVASRLHPGKKIIASEQAHYTHNRISEVLGIPYSAVAVTRDGRMDIADIESQLREGDVGTVVATMGTTGLGAVDPLADLVALQERYDFRIHADAAYGGYFSLASKLDDDSRDAFDAMSVVDSIVLDPHKHGLQPYGCGCILFRDPSVGHFYKHSSPFTYFSSAELHLGEISLECSRPGASAVALWATQQLFPLEKNGEFAAQLDDCLLAARDFAGMLPQTRDFFALVKPELDIVVYGMDAPDTSTASQRARDLFARAAGKDLHLALIELPTSMLEEAAPGIKVDSDTLTCLRSVFMKPEHRDWLEQIVSILESSARETG